MKKETVDKLSFLLKIMGIYLRQGSKILFSLVLQPEALINMSGQVDFSSPCEVLLLGQICEYLELYYSPGILFTYFCVKLASYFEKLVHVFNLDRQS